MPLAHVLGPLARPPVAASPVAQLYALRQARTSDMVIAAANQVHDAFGVQAVEAVVAVVAVSARTTQCGKALGAAGGQRCAASVAPCPQGPPS